jgi:hypothetical protein
MTSFQRRTGLPISYGSYLTWISRSAAIEYPYGRPVGQVGDREGQRKVLLRTLEVLEKAEKPGEVWHLPFTWPEEPKKTDWQPPEMSPLIKFLLGGY